DWLFDIDSLTISMNYVLVVARNQTNGIAGSKENLVAGQDDKKKELEQEYILIPICITDPLISQGTKDSAVDAGKKAHEVDESEASDNGGKNDQVSRSEFENLLYVLNRALVTKPHNKTPYELIRGRPPLIDFMKPFGCPVTILNTRDNLGKFEGKTDEGYFENAPNVKGNGPDFLFNIDSLTISMNYVPIVAGNQTNGIAGSKENLVATQDENKKELEQEYILIPICTTDPLLSQGSKDSAMDAEKKAHEVDESEALDNGGKNDQVSKSEVEGLPQQARQTKNINTTKNFNTVGSHVNTVGSSFVNATRPFASTNAFEEHSFE
nr:retrovirus-related Pol polyprotein from transposon TNT 1-94 [Tanacetum cinerariifolium]